MYVPVCVLETDFCYTCIIAPSADASGQRGATYGQGSGPILLDQVQCFGNESNVFDCPRNDIGMHNCAHDQDAGVTCTAREFTNSLFVIV